MLLVWENFFPIMERKVFYRNKIIKYLLNGILLLLLLLLLLL